MWNINSRIEFQNCVEDLLRHPSVCAMKDISAHHATNCYEHSVFVAYASYVFCRRWGLDYMAAARGGLLHDLFLYDQKDKSSHEGRHFSGHARAALHNASRDFSLTDKEKDIILSHMWPMVRPAPHYAESLVVGTADKLCALAEALFVYRWMRVRRRLSFA